MTINGETNKHSKEILRIKRSINKLYNGLQRTLQKISRTLPEVFLRRDYGQNEKFTENKERIKSRGTIMPSADMIESFYCDNCKKDYQGKGNKYEGAVLCDSCYNYQFQPYQDTKGRIEGKDGGLKNDAEKIDWSLYPLKTDEGIVKILMYGAKKYARNNWQKVENRRNFAALLRHLVKWQEGEELDPESGLPHLDHAACDLMFIRWRVEHNKEKGL